MRIFPDFFDWLEHHPFVMFISVLAEGILFSIILSMIIALSRPVY
jgi:hypothetical protein